MRIELTAERRRSVAQLTASWLGRGERPAAVEGAGIGAEEIEAEEVEILRRGRPGLLSILAGVRGRRAHVVLGLRRPGEAVDEAVLGLFDDGEGPALVVDALRDPELASLVLESVMGPPEHPEHPEQPVGVTGDEAAVTVAFERCSLTVFPWLPAGDHPAVSLMLALDEAGFNHLAAPLAVWRRGGRDLGFVQETLAGSADGWAVALTSLRDCYASGGDPERAGADFGPEARALGTMAARMHLALDRALGRDVEAVAPWAAAVESMVGEVEPAMLEAAGVGQALDILKRSDAHVPVVRAHGDFHLARTARTDQGWVLADCMPGGRGGRPVRRSPLGDVADLLWSLHQVATAAAAERDPAERGAPTAMAWEGRNRGSFLSAYLAAPGIRGLVPGDREMVGSLAAVFELERAAGDRLRRGSR